jgi:tRNA (adenine22-N1)-methyltransferase
MTIPMQPAGPAGRPPPLSVRLAAVADLVPPGASVIDVGTDHAFLPIWLALSGRCRQIAAIDLRSGPLSRARSHIARYGVQGRVMLHQGDGLSGLDLQADSVVILAGLGGHEIQRILEHAPGKPGTVIIQAMKSLPELRIWLGRAGYRLDREILACENGRYYPVVRGRHTGSPIELDDLTAWVGPQILANPMPEQADYLRFLLKRLEKSRLGRPELAALLPKIRSLLAKWPADATAPIDSE